MRHRPGTSKELHNQVFKFCQGAKSIDEVTREPDRLTVFYFISESDGRGVVRIVTHMSAWRVSVYFDNRTRAILEVVDIPQFL